MRLFAVLAACGAAVAEPEPSAAQPVPEMVRIGPDQRGLALPLPDAVLDALRARDGARAVSALRKLDPATLAGGRAKADWAFLVAWAATHGGDPASAADVLPMLDGGPSVPDSYTALVRGEVLLAQGKPLAALAAFERVPAGALGGAQAALGAAEALKALSRTKEAWERIEGVAARPDPADGNAEALLLLALHRGVGSDEAYPLLRRIWTWYPGSEPEVAAAKHLAAAYAGRAATWQERAARAERWMEQGAYTKALDETAAVASHAAGDSVDACRLKFARGRSQYKKNAITDASATLADIARSCVEVEGDYGPRGAYLLGTALYRRKAYAASAAAYRELADLYPDHSMADDGLTRGEIALLEAGRADDARKWWEEALAEHPAGDTVPEALLRLAFARYLSGDAADARAIATRLGALPLDGDAVHVQAGRYWAARWSLYPDAADPRAADPAAVQDAVDGWRALCEELPHSFYAILAYARLREVAPDVADAVAGRTRPPVAAEPPPWAVRPELARDPRVREGVALVRVGLVNEALAEWSEVDAEELAPDEKAWLAELRVAAGDWLAAHDDLRRWMQEHPIGTLGPNEAAIVRLAYPDRYWTEVRTAVQPTYRYEPRLFHALVREESSFNRTIVSFAGARGLSQLMPATAKQTAGWLGLPFSLDQLDEPLTNLRIGARYLDAMHKQLSDSPYLALAAYNGGAGNVEKWLAEQGNPPTDEYVERIPFEETRGYVKRVMGTWQTMRHRFDTGDPFPDLSRFNHRAKP